MESSISIVCTSQTFPWSINYVLHFGGVEIHKYCLYWSVFSTDINGNIIFNCLLLFEPFLLFSELYKSSQ